MAADTKTLALLAGGSALVGYAAYRAYQKVTTTPTEAQLALQTIDPTATGVRETTRLVSTDITGGSVVLDVDPATIINGYRFASVRWGAGTWIGERSTMHPSSKLIVLPSIGEMRNAAGQLVPPNLRDAARCKPAIFYIEGPLQSGSNALHDRLPSTGAHGRASDGRISLRQYSSPELFLRHSNVNTQRVIGWLDYTREQDQFGAGSGQWLETWLHPSQIALRFTGYRRYDQYGNPEAIYELVNRQNQPVWTPAYPGGPLRPRNYTADRILTPYGAPARTA